MKLASFAWVSDVTVIVVVATTAPVRKDSEHGIHFITDAVLGLGSLTNPLLVRSLRLPLSKEELVGFTPSSESLPQC